MTPDPTADPIITIDNVRACGFCGLGARRWFERHGFNFRHFVKNGAPASTLLATGDALALRVVDHKKAAD
jgi:hypothetical protein